MMQAVMRIRKTLENVRDEVDPGIHAPYEDVHVL